MQNIIKNKKGFFPAIGITLTVGTLIVIGIIIAILLVGTGLFLNFLTKNIFAIGGAFLLVVSFILLSKKSISQKFGGILIILGVLLILIQFSGIVQTIVPNNYYEVPVFSWLSCEVADSVKVVNGLGSYGLELKSSQITGDTDGWSIYTKVMPPGILPIKLKVEKNGILICERGWDLSKARLLMECQFSQLSPNDNIKIYLERKEWATYQPFSDATWTYEERAVPYGLFSTKLLGGGKILVNTRDCTISSEYYNNNVLSETITTITPKASGSNAMVGEHLPIGKPYNYVSDFVTVNGETLQTYNGQKVKCIQTSTTERVLYGFSTLTTQSGTYNILDLGKSLATVQCCERESTPSKTCQNGLWVVQAEAECSLTNPCAGAVWNINPSNNKQLIKYSCVNSKCVATTKNVQCTSGSQCAANQICVNYNCINAGTGNYTVNISENQTGGGIEGGACEDKFFGLIPASISTTKSCDWYDLLCSTGLTKPKEISECKYDYGLFILIIGGIIVVVAMILLLKPGNNTNKIKYVYRRRK